MLFGHHIEVTFFGLHFEPEGMVEHAIAFGATGIVFALAAYGVYALIRRLAHRMGKGGVGAGW